MTKHTGHNHPATPAARAACRKAAAAGTPMVVPVTRTADRLHVAAPKPFLAPTGEYGKCKIEGVHCENCGSTDYEDINLGDQGYSACCNECVNGQFDCRNHHG
jgi:hypothetical protein